MCVVGIYRFICVYYQNGSESFRVSTLVIFTTLYVEFQSLITSLPLPQQAYSHPCIFPSTDCFHVLHSSLSDCQTVRFNFKNVWICTSLTAHESSYYLKCLLGILSLHLRIVTHIHYSNKELNDLGCCFALCIFMFLVVTLSLL